MLSNRQYYTWALTLLMAATIFIWFAVIIAIVVKFMELLTINVAFMVAVGLTAISIIAMMQYIEHFITPKIEELIVKNNIKNAKSKTDDDTEHELK